MLTYYTQKSRHLTFHSVAIGCWQIKYLSIFLSVKTDKKIEIIDNEKPIIENIKINEHEKKKMNTIITKYSILWKIRIFLLRYYTRCP